MTGYITYEISQEFLQMMSRKRARTPISCRNVLALERKHRFYWKYGLLKYCISSDLVVSRHDTNRQVWCMMLHPDVLIFGLEHLKCCHAQSERYLSIYLFLLQFSSHSDAGSILFAFDLHEGKTTPKSDSKSYNKKRTEAAAVQVLRSGATWWGFSPWRSIMIKKKNIQVSFFGESMWCFRDLSNIANRM